MAITREKKEELLEQYKEQLEGASAVVFTDYRGISVSQIQGLRTKLKEAGATYMVVKNSILGLALDQLERERPETLLIGPKAVAFLGEDIGKGVTALKDWMRAEDKGSIEGGILETSILDAAGAAALADLPSKEDTLAMILGAISAPSGQLARTINAPASSLVRVLSAYVDKQQEAA
ncbi:MAG: 50S ribosomal protein L10 [Caldilineaceae bacterium]